MKTFKHVRKGESETHILIQRLNEPRLNMCQGHGANVRGWDERGPGSGG